MKSFGVRLAAGAVTILFGAYAAVLAQKDKQDDSDSWTAKVPFLGEPASPIADISDESWLSQPASQDQAGPSPADPLKSASPLQLVQHTEPNAAAENASAAEAPSFDPSMLPASLGSDEVSDAAATQAATLQPPDWSLPPQDEEGAAESGGPAVSMTQPDPPAESENSRQPESNLPELQLGTAPAMEFYPAGQTPQAVEPPTQGMAPEMTAAQDPTKAEGPGQEFATPVPADAMNMGQPSNILRGSDSSINALRNQADDTADGNPAGPGGSAGFPPSSSPPPWDDNAGDPRGPDSSAQHAVPATASGLAQNASPLGQFPGQFDQLAPSDAASGVGLGSPRSGPYGQPAGAGYPPQPAASLSREANPIPRGYPGGYQPSTMQQPTTAAAIDPAATVDAPGDRRLEGVQTPSIVIQKRAPSEVKVGKPASFVIHVQNVGTVEALDVVVHDRVPAGMRLIDASPAPKQQGNLLLWQLGAMRAGDERTVTMQLLPEQEGELGSVARVSFEAAASVRTISTRPELKIIQRAPETVLIGQQLEIELEVSNPGSGEATGVVLQEDVPEGLEHPKGRQLDNGLGNLAPGEVRNQVLRLRAVSPGIIENTIRLTGDDGLTAEHTVAVQIVAPDLKVELSGPSRRFLERQATYQLGIANVGTADATNIEIVVQLDRGFTFVSTENEGQYDPSRHAVFWSLAQLPAGGSGSVPLTLLPVEEGQQAMTIDARADLGIFAKSERTMTVEGFAELSFAITNPGGPIELGAETTYEIRVTNSGSKADSNVQVQLQLPPGLELINADGDAGTDGRGLVAFQPSAQILPGSELKYGIRARGVAPGTHIVKAVVISDQSSVPVTKEESTLVYADQ